MSPPQVFQTSSIAPVRCPVGGVMAALALALLVTLCGRPARAAGSSDSTVVVLWEAPGDDGSDGRAALYDLRFRTTPVVAGDTLSWWNGASPVGGMPEPGPAGSGESVVVGGLDPGFTYYFMLRVADEVPNWSDYSNVVVRPALIDVTPPAAIHDLNVVN